MKNLSIALNAVLIVAVGIFQSGIGGLFYDNGIYFSFMNVTFHLRAPLDAATDSDKSSKIGHVAINQFRPIQFLGINLNNKHIDNIKGNISINIGIICRAKKLHKYHYFNHTIYYSSISSNQLLKCLEFN